MIFHCYAILEKSIRHTEGGGGFTQHLNRFVEAGNSADASAGYQHFLEKQGLRVSRVTATVAAIQRKASYARPSDVLTINGRYSGIQTVIESNMAAPI